MKIIKNVLFYLFIAASMGAVSTAALAEAKEGRITYKAVDAIDLVVGRIQDAINGITSGDDGEAAAQKIKFAKDGVKEINSIKVDRARETATAKLKDAIKFAKENNIQEAEAALRDAHKQFDALKGLL